MALDEYTPDIDSAEWLWSSADAMREAVSEKFKEAVKKWTAGIKRIQKDEKKAKKYDFLLASFLVQIITNKKYDSLMNAIFSAMDAGYSSNFILWILSLVNTEVSNKIRHISWKSPLAFTYTAGEEIIEFNDTHLPKEIKTRINHWIEDIIDATMIDASQLQAIKNRELLEKSPDSIVTFTAQVFTFFLYEIQIKIWKTKALSISDFIVNQVQIELKKLEVTEL